MLLLLVVVQVLWPAAAGALQDLDDLFKAWPDREDSSITNSAAAHTQCVQCEGQQIEPAHVHEWPIASILFQDHAMVVCVRDCLTVTDLTAHIINVGFVAVGTATNPTGAVRSVTSNPRHMPQLHQGSTFPIISLLSFPLLISHFINAAALHSCSKPSCVAQRTCRVPCAPSRLVPAAAGPQTRAGCSSAIRGAGPALPPHAAVAGSAHPHMRDSP